jgi:hypothetical protein
MSQLLNRQAAATRRSKTTRAVHGQPGIPRVLPAGWAAVGPLPAAPTGGGAPDDAAGEGVPLIGLGEGDEVGEGEGERDGEGRGDARAVGFGLGDGLGVGVGADALIVYVAHAAFELTDVSVPHTRYAPGDRPLGGAVDGVELVHLPPVVDGAGLVAQSVVLPKDQDTCLWYAAHEFFGVNEYVAISLAPA